MKKKLFRIAGSILLVIIVLAGAAAAAFQPYMRSQAKKSFPQTDGTVQLPGLHAPVDIYRDKYGVPNIYAQDQHDLFFAQGYVHAQERFWQMDFWRHIGAGRLAEMFGQGQVDTDTFLRTMGWRRVAEQEWAQMDPAVRVIFEAYADGVNAYLNDHQGSALSLEYVVLGLLTPDYAPAPWQPVDSLTWAKAMAWDLRGNMNLEIERAVLSKTLTPEQLAELFPPYDFERQPVIVPHPVLEGVSGGASGAAIPQNALPPLESLTSRAAALDSVIGPSGEGIGSNSWVVSGDKTSTGYPLLANDPHLGIQMPSIWFEVGLHCQPKNAECPFDVVGFSFAGNPGVVIGHNDRIAWGFTNTGPDVIDLFIEKINPDNPNQYEYNGQWVDMDIVHETIQVAGGDPIDLTVRYTRHGPIISDSYGPLKDNPEPTATPFRERAGIDLPEHYAIAMRWTALEPACVFCAILGLNTAQNFDDFRQAAAQFAVPAQNLLYADVDGNIGYQMPGRIPIRKNGDGHMPVPGWTDAYEWQGYIPFEQLPYAFNPNEGYIVTANNPVVGPEYPYLITTDYTFGYRAERIIAMLQSVSGPIDIATYQKMHMDNYSGNAAFLVPVVLKAAPDTPAFEIARQLWTDWDYQQNADSASAALFEAFWRHLLAHTLHDDLPEAYWPEGGSRWWETMRYLVADSASAWWDDQTTPAVETRDQIFAAALEDAVKELRDRLGKDPAQWRWGDLHTATFRNGTLGESGIAPIENLFNRGPFPTSGGKAIVNATGWTATEGYEVDWLPSMRMIVDLSNMDNSVDIHTTGQSGHAYHPNYIDMAPMWATGKYRPMLFSRPQVEAAAKRHLVLKP
ncbi:MAG: penicillin acylase family protein [Anaerolineales bacterium]